MESQDRAKTPPPDHESASLMSDQPVAQPTQDKQNGYKVESVSIRQADNGGFTVSCSKTRELKGKESGGNGVSPSRDYKSTDNVFSNVDDMLAYVKSEFSGGSDQSQQAGGYQQPAVPSKPARGAAAAPAPGDAGGGGDDEGDEDDMGGEGAGEDDEDEE